MPFVIIVKVFFPPIVAVCLFVDNGLFERMSGAFISLVSE